MWIFPAALFVFPRAGVPYVEQKEITRLFPYNMQEVPWKFRKKTVGTFVKKNRFEICLDIRRICIVNVENNEENNENKSIDIRDSLSYQFTIVFTLRETGNAPFEQRHWLCAFFYSVRLPRASANRYATSNVALSHDYIFRERDMISVSWER